MAERVRACIHPLAQRARARASGENTPLQLSGSTGRATSPSRTAARASSARSSGCSSSSRVIYGVAWVLKRAKRDRDRGPWPDPSRACRSDRALGRCSSAPAVTCCCWASPSTASRRSSSYTEAEAIERGFDLAPDDFRVPDPAVKPAGPRDRGPAPHDGAPVKLDSATPSRSCCCSAGSRCSRRCCSRSPASRGSSSSSASSATRSARRPRRRTRCWSGSPCS